jgi:hypothetical protein
MGCIPYCKEIQMLSFADVLIIIVRVANNSEKFRGHVGP